MKNTYFTILAACSIGHSASAQPNKVGAEPAQAQSPLRQPTEAESAVLESCVHDGWGQVSILYMADGSVDISADWDPLYVKRARRRLRALHPGHTATINTVVLPAGTTLKHGDQELWLSCLGETKMTAYAWRAPDNDWLWTGQNINEGHRNSTHQRLREAADIQACMELAMPREELDRTDQVLFFSTVDL